MRYPRVVSWNKKIRKKSEFLSQLFVAYEEFAEKHPKFFSYDSEIDTLRVIYSLINGHTRRTQSDLYHILGMTEETRPYMRLDRNAFPILEAFKLDRPFITIQRGVDKNFKGSFNTRLWPLDYYSKLI